MSKEKKFGSKQEVEDWIIIMADLKVKIVQLDQDNNAPKSIAPGVQMDSEEITLSGDNQTIGSLKTPIVQKFFPGKTKTTSQIKVFAEPADAVDTSLVWPAVTSDHSLQNNMLYGFRDYNKLIGA
jgi:hypothetical protein